MPAFFSLAFVLTLFFQLPSFAKNLPSQIKSVKPSIVAIGTHMAIRRPASKLFGTGFIVADGHYVITNFHVLPKEIDKKKREKLAIFFRKNKKIEYRSVKIIDTDSRHDLALLKIIGSKLPALSINKKENPKEGESIFFVGFPIGAVLGLYPVTHQGIISTISPIGIPFPSSAQLSSKIIRHLKRPYDVYQLDATAYPGNSGSPLISQITNRVIGVINKVFIKETKESVLQKPSGITYAIPSKHILSLLQQNHIKP